MARGRYTCAIMARGRYTCAIEARGRGVWYTKENMPFITVLLRW